MAKIKVIYDFHEEAMHPFTFTIKFGCGELPWEKNALYIPLTAPFQKLRREDIHDDLQGCSVLLEDLIVNEDKPGAIGISLQRIRERHHIEATANDEPIMLVVRMADIEEVMQMEPYRDRFAWS